MSGHIIVLTSVGTEDDAARIAREIVEKRLAACVSISSPVRSLFRWKDRVHDEPERMLIIKTVRENFERLRQTIVTLHRYELPEIIAVPIEIGDETYLNWLTAHSADEPVEE